MKVKLVPLRDTAEKLAGKPAKEELPVDKAIDVIVDDPSKLARIGISYTDEDLRRWGVAEETLKLYRWDPGSASGCRSAGGVDPVNNVVWAEPQPSELVGVPVAPAGAPVQLAGGELELPAQPRAGGTSTAVVAAALAGVALAVAALALYASHGPGAGGSPGPCPRGRALVADALSVDFPNPGLDRFLVETLEQAGYRVDYVNGTGVDLELYRRLTDYDVVILRVHGG